MALEKDKERPTSPIQRLSAQKRAASHLLNSNRNFDNQANNFTEQYQTFDQACNNIEEEKRNTPSQYSESPMIVGRDMSGYGDKNMLLSPGGQVNNMSKIK